MLQAFRLAYTNLREIWSLVLPPNTLLGLKRLYSTPDSAAFRMPDNLWARIVYDFLLAYRLRTINRGHLLGALIPLYLAWVASHLGIIASGIDPEHHIEAGGRGIRDREALSCLSLALARQVQPMKQHQQCPQLTRSSRRTHRSGFRSRFIKSMCARDVSGAQSKRRIKE